MSLARRVWWVLLALAALAAWARHRGPRVDRDWVPPDATAAVCAVALREGPYLDEWVRYHLALGFDAVYVYDNSDDNELRDLPAAYPPGAVHVRHWPGKAQQVPSYNHFLRHSDGHTWAAFLDVDEFLVLKKHADVKSLLREHCRSGSLALNWYMFGSSGRQAYEPAPVLQRFQRRCARVDQFVKSIVRVADVAHMDVHQVDEFVPGAYQRDTSGHVFAGSLHPGGPSDVAVVHHYFTKSRGEFVGKRARGMATNHDVRSMDEFDAGDYNDVHDSSAWDAARRMGVFPA